jgi:ABC-2 type transport system permease protein
VLRGLAKLTWLEIKIFVREPMGLVGTLAFPVVIFVVMGRAFAPAARSSPERGAQWARALVSADLPVFATLMIALSAVLSLVTIIAIYREGGILKRLRATPLRATTILLAHVLVKLLLTAVSLGLMLLAGRRFYPMLPQVPLASFAAALVFSTASILSLGFVMASLVPTARFAQPVGAALLYPMVALSGLFWPISAFPPFLRAVARVLPLTYAVSLLRGIWLGEPWSAHLGDVAALLIVAAIGVVLSARFFRWE